MRGLYKKLFYNPRKGQTVFSQLGTISGDDNTTRLKRQFLFFIDKRETGVLKKPVLFAREVI